MSERHKRLNLMPLWLVDIEEHDSMRPNLSVWFDREDACVTLNISATWGQSNRYVNMTPDEARKLAKFLLDTADEVNAHVKV